MTQYSNYDEFFVEARRRAIHSLPGENRDRTAGGDLGAGGRRRFFTAGFGTVHQFQESAGIESQAPRWAQRGGSAVSLSQAPKQATNGHWHVEKSDAHGL